MSLVGFKAQNHKQQTAKRGALEKVDDRRTPAAIFDPLNEEFEFTLDAAASVDNALVEWYFDLAANGLEQPWGEVDDPGHVWCNPPYSDCGAWVEKANAEFFAGRVNYIVMLLPANRTEQKWWQEHVEPYRYSPSGGHIEARFLPGRIRFGVPDGTYSDPRGNRPPFGCVLLVWDTHYA